MLREHAAAAEAAAAGGSFSSVRQQLPRASSSSIGAAATDVTAGVLDGTPSVESALWFCLIVAEQRAKRQRKLSADPAAAFGGVARSFAHCVGRLSAAASAASPAAQPVPRLISTDARQLSLATPVACILTSPPYPGIYDYLSMARQERAAHGEAPIAGLSAVPDGRDWPAAWSSGREIGARRAMKKQRGGFRAAWEGKTGPKDSRCVRMWRVGDRRGGVC